MREAKDVIEWLLDGDPAVRWQVRRDLLGESPSAYEADRARIAEEGWGRQFLECLNSEGTWPNERWTGPVWTLCTLVDLGFPSDEPNVQRAAELFLERHLTAERALDRSWQLKHMDLCHLGFWLRIGAYFGFYPERLKNIADTLLSVQFADGGWNCRMRMKPSSRHSSFHTTFNVLGGLREAAWTGLIPRTGFQASEDRAMEFMVAHRMYRSDRTGEVVDQRFTHLAYPSHWHYTVLRGLDYMRLTGTITDERLADPLDLIEQRRKPNGRWVVEKRIPGISLFDLEKQGGDSRWNTLRAMRTLKASGRSA